MTSLAAGVLAIGVVLVAGPAATKPAAKPAPPVASRQPSTAQVESLLREITAPGRPAPKPSGYTADVTAGVLDYYYYNWSGYADVSATPQYFSRVSGAWTVPAVTCTAEDRMVVNWVGLDGATNQTVEQDGTFAWCFEGTAHYYTWYEMYPTIAITTVGSTVKPGDKITASVTRKGTTYVMKLTDSTTPGNNIATNQTCALATCVDESAEWITERPDEYSTGYVPLAQFPTATFRAASATGGGKSGAITAFGTPWNITMIDSTDTYPLSSTSALNPLGKVFTNKWLNSY